MNERACVIFYALVCSFSFSFFLCCFTLIKFSYVNFILIFFFFSNSLRIFKVKCIRNKIFFVTNTTRKFFTLFESVFCYEQNIFTLIFLWFPYHTYTRTYHVYIINPFVLLFFFIYLASLSRIFFHHCYRSTYKYVRISREIQSRTQLPWFILFLFSHP